MMIRQVMNQNVASCTVKDSCLEAARLMRDRGVGFVVVTDIESGKVAGVVTDRDICLAGLKKDKPLREIPVKFAMTADVHSCRDDSDLMAAHLTMRKHHVRRLPVLDPGGALVGVVSVSDLAREASERIQVRSTPDIVLTLAQVTAPHPASVTLRQEL